MAEPMSQKSRNEYLEKMRDRYRRYKGRRARGKLITEFCEVTGHEREYANKLLGKKRGPGRTGPPSKIEQNRGQDEIIAYLAILHMIPYAEAGQD
jgi:hypothetical protein